MWIRSSLLLLKLHKFLVVVRHILSARESQGGEHKITMKNSKLMPENGSGCILLLCPFSASRVFRVFYDRFFVSFSYTPELGVENFFLPRSLSASDGFLPLRGG